ncbi:phosphoribosyl 1,2-cyclic phosphodiesterase [Mobilisporobacter senegalensis]|uniref:Phosphoribosyl 1,2-cyclic phosphodiesterase n=1 Tax=Mobilisporobacter senegalensis TaxID=1329262 RepID=A0A3N1XWP0_9FIRM|nr:MBL fold metallo-hydrolase [Mobilisporobacter senegalensis]ROR29357.1 phosphoribosyl 1,2-cyclic phosphodiesterase [Mobilisporobacter senegalensis]
MKLCSIASGSSGNCIYVGNNNTNLLVDVGISGKRIESGLISIDIDPKTIDGILITHEHSDHISGLGVMARRYGIPIYATVETISAILRIKSIGKISEELFRYIEPDVTFEINDMAVNPFSISHDASNPVCYTFTSNGQKIGVATDLGKYDDYIVSNLKGSEVLLLEANHDVNMLQVGAYPYHLKRRILGDRGHLSNDNSGRLISELLHDKLKHIFLGHLSKENNYPELAYETVKIELENNHCNVMEHISLRVAKRDEPSDYIII